MPWAGRTLSGNSSDNPEEFRLTLGEHLEELRQRLFRILGILMVGFAVGWMIEPWAYKQLSEVASANIPATVEYKETFRHITEPFFLKVKLAFYLGLIMTLPLTVFQVWGFVAPGLKPQERRPFQLVAPVSVVLFAMGCALCWMILPAAFEWFASFIKAFPGVALYQEPATMVMFMVRMMLAFGIGFQVPIVVFALGKVGLITAGTMLQYWRHCIVGSFILAALLTPSGDWFTMSALALPLVVLVFASIYAVKLTERKKPLPAGPPSPEE